MVKKHDLETNMRLYNVYYRTTLLLLIVTENNYIDSHNLFNYGKWVSIKEAIEEKGYFEDEFYNISEVSL
jgi:hypothetical protein